MATENWQLPLSVMVRLAIRKINFYYLKLTDKWSGLNIPQVFSKYIFKPSTALIVKKNVIVFFLFFISIVVTAINISFLLSNLPAGSQIASTTVDVGWFNSQDMEFRPISSNCSVFFQWCVSILEPLYSLKVITWISWFLNIRFICVADSLFTPFYLGHLSLSL